MDQTAANSTSNVGAKTILVIDDDTNYREIIVLTLQTLGYIVIEAGNGLDGLEAAKKNKPDLVLCDVNMPTMDGHTLLTTLKKDPHYGSIPFIFLTGNAEKNDVRQGMQLGADDYLTKPFVAEELIAAIETRLTRKKSLQNYYESKFEDIKTSIVMSLPHEFRTPLHGILGYAQILQEETDLPTDEVKEIGALIHKSGQRLHHLLENMILFGELQFRMHDQESVAAMRQESTTLLYEVIRSAAEQEALPLKRADAVNIDVKEAAIQISTAHFTKIITEILNNALKFSAPGTKINISSEVHDTDIVITIRDEGRGMSVEQISMVAGFQQFERRRHEQQGAGLGLAIAKALTELYGGALIIESKIKTGTSVKIKLLKAPF